MTPTPSSSSTLLYLKTKNRCFILCTSPSTLLGTEARQQKAEIMKPLGLSVLVSRALVSTCCCNELVSEMIRNRDFLGVLPGGLHN